MSDENEYVPFGEEWEKEVMKSPKRFIMEQFRRAAIKNVDADKRAAEAYEKTNEENLRCLAALQEFVQENIVPLDPATIIGKLGTIDAAIKFYFFYLEKEKELTATVHKQLVDQQGSLLAQSLTASNGTKMDAETSFRKTFKGVPWADHFNDAYFELMLKAMEDFAQQYRSIGTVDAKNFLDSKFKELPQTEKIGIGEEEIIGWLEEYAHTWKNLYEISSETEGKLRAELVASLSLPAPSKEHLTDEEIEIKFPCEVGQKVIMEPDMNYDQIRQANYYRRQGARAYRDLSIKANQEKEMIELLVFIKMSNVVHNNAVWKMSKNNMVDRYLTDQDVLKLFKEHQQRGEGEK